MVGRDQPRRQGVARTSLRVERVVRRARAPGAGSAVVCATRRQKLSPAITYAPTGVASGDQATSARSTKAVPDINRRPPPTPYFRPKAFFGPNAPSSSGCGVVSAHTRPPSRNLQLRRAIQRFAQRAKVEELRAELDVAESLDLAVVPLRGDAPNAVRAAEIRIGVPPRGTARRGARPRRADPRRPARRA